MNGGMATNGLEENVRDEGKREEAQAELGLAQASTSARHRCGLGKGCGHETLRHGNVCDFDLCPFGPSF